MPLFRTCICDPFWPVKLRDLDLNLDRIVYFLVLFLQFAESYFLIGRSTISLEQISLNIFYCQKANFNPYPANLFLFIKSACLLCLLHTFKCNPN